MIKEQVQALDAEAQKTKMTFEKYYKKIKQTGLSSYKVELPKMKISYYSKSENFIEKEPLTYKVSKKFDKAALEKTFAEAMQDKIDHFQYLDAIAKAGCHHYVVNFAKDTLTCYNEDESASQVGKIAW